MGQGYNRCACTQSDVCQGRSSETAQTLTFPSVPSSHDERVQVSPPALATAQAKLIEAAKNARTTKPVTDASLQLLDAAIEEAKSNGVNTFQAEALRETLALTKEVAHDRINELERKLEEQQLAADAAAAASAGDNKADTANRIAELQESLDNMRSTTQDKSVQKIHVSFALEDTLDLSRYRDEVMQRNFGWTFTPLLKPVERDKSWLPAWKEQLDQSQAIFVLTTGAYYDKLEPGSPLMDEARAIADRIQTDIEFRVFCFDPRSEGLRDHHLALMLKEGKNEMNLEWWLKTVRDAPNAVKSFRQGDKVSVLNKEDDKWYDDGEVLDVVVAVGGSSDHAYDQPCIKVRCELGDRTIKADDIDGTVRHLAVTGESLCIEAAEGNTAAVLALIRKFADVNFATAGGATPLRIAAAKGHLDVVEVLISKRADTERADDQGVSPLFIAADQYHSNVVQALLIGKANVDRTAGKAPPCPNCSQRMTWSDYKQGPYSRGWTCSNMITCGSDGRAGSWRWFCATCSSDLCETCVPKDSISATPLFIASQNGFSSVVQVLLAANADVDLAKNGGATPLFVSAHNGHVAVAQALLATRAKLNIDRPQGDGATPLFVAAQNGFSAVVEVLVGARASVNLANDDGASPLFIAVQFGHKSVVECLVSSAADVNYSAKGFTALSLAEESGRQDIAELFRNHQPGWSASL